MRNYIVLLFCVFTFVCNSSVIDNIIRARWESFLHSGLADNNLFDKRDPTSLIHNCQHDTFMKQSGASKRYSLEGRKRLIKENDKRSIESTQNTTQPSVPTAPTQNSTQNNQTNWSPIRIYPDSRWISTSDPYSCSIAGQVVTLDQYYSVNGESTNKYTCQDSDVLTTTTINTLQNYIIPTIVDILYQLLSVVRVNGQFILPSEYHDIYGKQCRSNLDIPDSMIDGPGVPNTDFYIMVTARPIPNPNTLANALSCSHNILNGGRFDRPLAGSINFNPGSTALSYSPSDYFRFSQNIKTGLHEMTHALGFSSDMYGDYRTPEGGFYADGSVIQSQYNGGIKWKINTPRVVSFVREHYACSSLDGMELEDYNQNGQAGSHWEARIVDSEYMAGVASPDSQLSYLTLSFFEDMGWYKSNYSMVEQWNYGAKEGCNWVQQACSSSAWNRYWCDTKGQQACNGPRTAFGYCNVATYTASLPTEYEYFTNPAVGGDDGWNDYCPKYTGYANKYCHDSNGESDNPGNPYSEVYGPGSNCWDIVSPQSMGCFPTKCFVDTDGNQTLQVQIGGSWWNCPRSGGNMNISPSGKNTVIFCPFVEFFCVLLGSNGVNFTFDSSNNIPVQDVPNSPGQRPPPKLPDLPFLPPSLPSILPPTLQTLFNDPWDIAVGSNSFYLLIAIGVAIILCVLFMLCRR